MKLPSALVALFGGSALLGCTPSPPAADRNDAPTADAARTAFVEDLSRRTFDYFWETTDVERCLAPDRWPSNPFSSIAATGFAITAYAVGAERGYVTREQAADRTLKCVEFYWTAPQGPGTTGISGHKGFFYHFLRNDDGTRYRDTELSTVDTTLLLGGILFAQAYYDRDDPTEAQIRNFAEKIYRRVDWTFVQRGNSRIPSANGGSGKAIAMGWYPERGQGGDVGTHDWVGFNEGMLVYILAAGSPTPPIALTLAMDMAAIPTAVPFA